MTPADRPVLVVADHPSRTTGFSTVATNVAGQLTARGWAVRYLGLGTDTATTGHAFEVEPIDDYEALVARVVDASSQRPRVLCFGTAEVPVELGKLLRDAGVRERVDLTCYLAVEHVLVPDLLRVLERRVDRIVPATAFAAAAMQLDSADPIPHGVDVSAFQPLSTNRRTAVRRHEFDAGPDDLLIGYVGRNSGHKRPDLALRAFAHLATGAHATCRSCGWLTVAELAPGRGFLPVRRCRHCAVDALAPGRPDERALMAMHTELLGEHDRRRSRGFDLLALAHRFGVAERVRFDPDLAPGRGFPIARLAARMAALDIHLLLHCGGGWELTVLETAACGVPHVVTDYAGPAEYAAPFSRLIPVGHQVVRPWGVEGVADLDLAVRALVELIADPDERTALGARGVEAARRFGWDHVGRRWHDLLLADTMGA